MFSRDKDKLAMGKLLMFGSYLSALMAVFGAMGTDIYLASTQWVLVGLLLACWAIYILVEAQFRLKR